MNTASASQVGLVAVGTFSLAVLGTGLWLGLHSSASGAARVEARLLPAMAPSPAPVPVASADPLETVAAVRNETPGALVDRFVALLSSQVGATGEQDELERLEAALLSLSETGALALIDRLDRGRDGAVARDRLLDLLRKAPGEAAEDRLAREARAGKSPQGRAIAIEALAERRTDRSVRALGEIARTDPKLPERPLIAAPRDPSDPSTELPDEVVFTPRMQAMAALATTGHPEAAAILTGVLREGPDESLRMEAARNLTTLRGEPGTSEALRLAAAGDASPYVRLAALHASRGSTDPLLRSVLEGIAARDADAGVRILALEVLASLPR